MGSILFARADAFETFGIGAQTVVDAGASVLVWEAVKGEPAPPLDNIDGVVVFGSSSNIEHADEQRFIHALRDVTLETLDRELPLLGICFGAQVLAWSLGAPIEKAPVREVGYVPLRPVPTASDEVADTVEADWGKSPAALRAEADRFQAAHERAGAEVFRRFTKVTRERP
jgi:GMP synthase (glutamine-hydrolysing)